MQNLGGKQSVLWAIGKQSIRKDNKGESIGPCGKVTVQVVWKRRFIPLF